MQACSVEVIVGASIMKFVDSPIAYKNTGIGHRNMIGMHMQNRGLKTHEFCKAWLFGSQEWEKHRIPSKHG
jgi:hypothetical protein